MNFLKLFAGSRQRHEDRLAELHRGLIRREAKLGGELFGPIPEGGRREFFCLDEHTWIWHEEWLDGDGKRRIKTTRYDVRPGSILKAQDGQRYSQVGREEARNLLQAAEAYVSRVKSEIYAPLT
jgi:hypothetical protein